MQRTLKKDVALEGIGLHSGRRVRMCLRPAFAGHGIWFRRTDVTHGDNLIAAAWDNVSDTQLNTRIANADGATVSTVEHVMAALAGCGVHNALIEIDGPEVPVFDGSSMTFAQAILEAGVVEQDAPLSVIRIKQAVRFEQGDAYVELSPADTTEIAFTIDFADAAIGRQSHVQTMANGAFLRELCNCRTFCRQSDVDAMRANGLALGGSMKNAIVVEGAKVLNPEGLRRPDEFVRHKMLDVLGDLSLAGAPIIGRYDGYKAGHAMTNAVLRKLFATPAAFEIGPATRAVSARLPGEDIRASDLVLQG